MLRVSEVLSIDTSQSHITIVHTTYGALLMYKDTDRELQQLAREWQSWVDDGRRERELYYNFRDQTGGKRP